MRNVTIYSTPTCGYCRMAKQFFTEKGVSYNEYDVAADVGKRNEMVNLTGQMGVPVIVIQEEGGKPDVIVGFDKPRIMEILEIS